MLPARLTAWRGKTRKWTISQEILGARFKHAPPRAGISNLTLDGRSSPNKNRQSQRDTSMTSADLSDGRKTQFARLADHIAHHLWSLIEEPTSLAAYARIDMPTLILCATHSPGPSRTIVRLLDEALPRAGHCSVPNARHTWPITHPTEVNRFILEHLSKNGAQIDTRGQEENSAATSGVHFLAPARSFQ